MPYALEEVQSLVHDFQVLSVSEKRVRYVCALFSELAYYHISQKEIDEYHRFFAVPCAMYQLRVALSRKSDVSLIIRNLPRNADRPNQPIGEPFVIEGEKIMAVGLRIGKILFVSFRGTNFYSGYDWRVNLNVPWMASPDGNFHTGFREECARIADPLEAEIRKQGPLDHIFLTGHSLGGAVAAIAEYTVRTTVPYPTGLCMFGAPRYCDAAAYHCLGDARINEGVNVRRPRDLVPTVPPTAMGYADHPHQLTTFGTEFTEPDRTWFFDMIKIAWVAEHSMERYRKEVGIAAGANSAMHDLVNLDFV